jgi:broad specificity phosphatase PhoE/predicted kinase
MSESLRVELPLAVASFQDLVLIGRPGSESDGTTTPLSRSASPAPRDADNTPVPESSARAALRAHPASRDPASMAKHVARALGIADDHDSTDDSTPDAEAAANAAASVNAAMDQVGAGAAAGVLRRAATVMPGGARSPRRGADRSPPRHLEMAVSAPDGVVDASAVSFLAAPRASAAPGSGATATDRRRLAIIMVGLPARGKSFTAHKLARYLTWLGHETRHFNVGKYRRDFVGRKCSAEFFDPGNDSAVASRNAVAKLAMEDMLSWMEQRGGQVGIFDATNSTRGRRQMLTDMCRGRCKVIFLETVCTDMALIRRNVQEKVTASPDYAGTDPEEALRDFMRRMDEYEKAYEPLGSGPHELPEAHSFIRVVDIASGSGSMQVSRIQGYLPGRIVYFLLNAQLAFRPIYLCRHGKSEDNMAEKIGGDSGLSPAGKEFAQRLRGFMENLPAAQRPSAVWTSTLRRTIQTARPLGAAWPQVQWRALDEIDAGACEGLTYAEIKAAQPDEYAARTQDKLRYRYPRGESYLDVIQRLEPVIIEIERQRSPVLIVAHQAVLRCLYACVPALPDSSLLARADASAIHSASAGISCRGAWTRCRTWTCRCTPSSASRPARTACKRTGFR